MECEAGTLPYLVAKIDETVTCRLRKRAFGICQVRPK